MKKFALVLTMLLLPLATACNTVEGLGQDVQKGGENLEEAADENKR